MSYHQDWLMRQIEAITAMLGYILTGKKASHVTIDEHQQSYSGENELYLQLRSLTLQKKICEAENLLFEALDDPTAQVLDAATRFYRDINELSDAELIACNFSREEIMSGLQEVCSRFNIPL